MKNNYYKRKQGKAFKKGSWKVPKSSEEEKDKRRQYGHEQYRNLSEAEKETKPQYGREQYENLLEDEKQRLAEYITIF